MAPEIVLSKLTLLQRVLSDLKPRPEETTSRVFYRFIQVAIFQMLSEPDFKRAQQQKVVVAVGCVVE